MDIFKCDICGNLAELINDNGVPMVCCGQEMTKQEVNTQENVFKKHIPVVKEENEKIKVQIGEVFHPMIEGHYIEWVAMVADGTVFRKSLYPTSWPIVSFDKVSDNYEIYAYCNIHGLYKNSWFLTVFLIFMI